MKYSGTTFQTSKANESMRRWMEQTNERMHARANKQTNKQRANKQTNKQRVNKRTNKRTTGHLQARIHERANEQTIKRTNGNRC